MMRESRRAQAWFALVTTGAVGVLGAHVVTYLLALRDPIVRSHVLGRTHAYLPRVWMWLLALAIVGAALTVRRGWIRGHADASFGGLFARLVLIQVPLFLALELSEHVPSSVSRHHLALALPIGVALQIATAAAGALIQCLFNRAGAWAAAIWRARPARASSVIEPTAAREHTQATPALATLGPRAPPALLAA